MSAISQQYLHTCTLTTPGTSVSNDADNQPIPGSPVVVSAVLCRYGDLDTVEIQRLADGGLRDVSAYLVCGASQNLVPGKTQVSGITSRRGVVEFAGPLLVKRIAKRRGNGIEYQRAILGVAK